MMKVLANPAFSIPKFEAGDIDPDRFDHEAHVYVAWLYVREFPLAEALAKFDAALQRLVIKLGANGKYHTTLTWFFLLVIAERAQSDQPWYVFKRSNADLLGDSKQLLSRYYSEEFLFSEKARENFVLPDNLATN
jgi:hypothetical protein